MNGFDLNHIALALILSLISAFICEAGSSKLPYYAGRGDFEEVKKMVSQGAPIEAYDMNGKTALYMAATNGHLEVVKYLLSKGADPLRKTDVETTPLSAAVSSRHLDCLKAMLKGRNFSNRTGAMLLYEAVDEDYDACVDFLLSKGAKPDAFQDLAGRTALHLACQAGNNKIVGKLLVAGASVKKYGSGSHTPLHYAASCGASNIAVISRLLVRGCRLDQMGDDGRTALHLAAQRGHPDNVKYLLSKGAKLVNSAETPLSSPLHEAASRGNVEIAKMLVEAGGDCQAVSKKGNWTPLHHARNLDIAVLLLNNGADVNATNSRGQPPLYMAYGDVKLFRLLVNRGATMGLKDKARGWTPVHRAAAFGSPNVIKYVAEAARDRFYDKDKKGNLPIHLAAREGKVDSVRIMLEYGVPPDTLNAEKQTPLHCVFKGHAMARDRLNVIQVLVKAKASLGLKDSSEKTPLDYAKEKKNDEIIKLLQDSK